MHPTTAALPTKNSRWHWRLHTVGDLAALHRESMIRDQMKLSCDNSITVILHLSDALSRGFFFIISFRLFIFFTYCMEASFLEPPSTTSLVLGSFVAYAVKACEKCLKRLMFRRWRNLTTRTVTFNAELFLLSLPQQRSRHGLAMGRPSCVGIECGGK